MILLLGTTDTLNAVTTGTGTLDGHTSFVDVNGTTVTPGRTNVNITTATTTVLAAAPGASVSRNVKTINLRNKHATSPISFSITHAISAGVTAELWEGTLLAQESLSYIEGAGWALYDANNQLKTVSGIPGLITRVLSADQSNSTVTPTEVTGLTVALGVGTYAFQYYIRYQAAAATTGVRFSVNHDGTLAFFVANEHFADLVGTASSATPDQDSVLAAATVYGVFSARAKSQAGWGTTLSVDTANADMLTIIEGSMQVTAAGSISLWHGSEVAAASTVKTGSMVIIFAGTT